MIMTIERREKVIIWELNEMNVSSSVSSLESVSTQSLSLYRRFNRTFFYGIAHVRRISVWNTDKSKTSDTQKYELNLCNRITDASLLLLVFFAAVSYCTYLRFRLLLFVQSCGRFMIILCACWSMYMVLLSLPTVVTMSNTLSKSKYLL